MSQIPEADIHYFKSEDKGSGLPFAIVSSDELFASDDLFVPSLRDFHVIFWFKKGKGNYYIDFKKYEFEPGTIILLSKDQVSHFDRMDPREVEIQSIVFQPSFIYQNDNDLKHLFQFTMSDHIEGIQILQLDKSTQGDLSYFSSQMTKVLKGWNHSDKSSAFYHWLCLFLIYVEKLQTDENCEEATSIDEHSRILMDFNQSLEKHFRQEFKVDFYAQELGISTKLLSRLTKDRFRLSPKAVIDQRRILEIKRLLRGTKLPVKNIAYDLGFDEPTNMVKYFKKHTELTPNQFRENPE